MLKNKDNNSSYSFKNTSYSYMPNNASLEMSVLGSILIDDRVMIDVVEKLHTSDFFYSKENQCIYDAMLELFRDSKKVDIFSVQEILKRDKIFDNIIYDDLYLIDLQNNASTHKNIYLNEWCDILKNLYSVRQMIMVCGSAIDNCYEADLSDTENVFNRIENEIFSVRQSISDSINSFNLRDCVKDAFKYIDLSSKDDDTYFFKTRIQSIDSIIRGIHKKELIVIAARPSVGKTSLLLNIINNLIFENKKVVLFSLEMSQEQVMSRMLYNISGISLNDLTYDQSNIDYYWKKLTECGEKLSNTSFFVDATPSLSVEELRAKAIRLKANDKMDVMFLDYLQLLRATVRDNDVRQVEVAKISAFLKYLSRELDIPVVVAAQLNRQAEEDAFPKLGHLRESGSIEQDADVVIFLNRKNDNIVDNEDYAKRLRARKNIMEIDLIVAKNRNGNVGVSKLEFLPQINEFRSIIPDDEESDLIN